MLKEAGPRSVRVVRRPDGSRRTLKAWPLTPWLLFKCLLGISQPIRQRRGARRLARHDIQTPRPRGLRLGWLGCPVLLLELDFIEGQTGLDRLRAGRATCADAQSLGRIAGRLASVGLRHRDFKLSNVVFDEAGQPWLIDPVGVVRDRDAIAALACMLDRLEVEARDGLIVLPDELGRAGLRAALRGWSPRQRRAIVRRLRTHRSR